MTEKEDEQLLADASTLLMFANTAARQRSPDASTQPKIPDPSVKSTTPPTSTPSGGTSKPADKSLPPQTVPPPVFSGQNTHLPPMVSMNPPPQTFPPVSSQKLAGTSHPDSGSPPMPKPHLVHIRPAQQVHPGGLGHPGYSYYPYGYVLGHPLGHPQAPSHGPPPLLGAPMLFTAHNAPPVMLTSSEVPSQKVSPQISPSVQQMYLHDTSKAANTPPADRAQLAFHLPHHGNLPVQGSFQTHRRTVSAGHQPESMIGKVTPPSASPGPANVTLSRGINVETGKRNNDNAMIAAAALAAAAEVPFPLKNKDEIKNAGKNEQQKDEASHPKGILQVSGATIVKTEDSVMTEPEDDENRTEDEPESRGTAMLDAAEELTGGLNIGTRAAAETSAPHSPQPKLEKASRSHAETTGSANIASHPSTTQNSPSNSVIASPASGKAIRPNTKVAFQPPPLSEYKVDPDSGMIGCICGIEEDDGFTIQCDVCFRWQHCSCMGYKTNEEVPEDVYKCYYCDETKWNRFDPAVCRTSTLARLDLDKVNEPQFKPAPPKRKTLNSGGEEKKRRKSEKDARGPDKLVADKRKPSLPATNMPTLTSPTSATFDINNKDNPLLEEGVSVELYQSVYYKLKDYDYKTKEVKKQLEEWGREYEQSGLSGIDIMTPTAYKGIKFSKVNLPNYQKYLQDRNELRRGKGFNETTIQVKAYSDNPKQKFIGISKMGLFITKRADASDGDVIPAGIAVIEYLGEVDFLELYMANLANQYSTWGTVKPQVARVNLQLQENAEPIPIVLDARFVGNEARFIRKSCATTANCEIRSVYIPLMRTFKHIVYTTKPITLKGENLEEELRLKWEWDKNHPINKMIELNPEGNSVEGLKFEDFTDEEKVLLVSGVDTILNFVECACNTTSINLQCSIFKIKKATSYLLRSTRKASSLTNIAFNKSKDELVMPRKSKQYISWKERLTERDELLHMSIFSTSTTDDNSESNIESQYGAAEEEEGVMDSQITPDEEEPEHHRKTQKLPYKQQLISHGRKYATRKYITDSGDATIDNANHVPKTIAVPLVSDIIVSIKEAVNNTLKPLAKISSNVNIVANSSQLAQPRAEAEPSQQTRKEASPGLLAKTESPVAETKLIAPPVVKKLSFADYKKKMK